MITAYVPTQWEAIRRMPISDDGSALSVLPSSSLCRVIPVYALAGIAGAVEVCYLRSEVIARLLRAAEQIAQSGYCLTVLDGWRPPAVQKSLYHNLFAQIQQRYPNESEAQWHRLTQDFVALPSEHPLCPSPHLTGGSVDVSLSDAQGELLDMGSAFDESSARAHSDAYEHQPGPIRDRRRILHEALYAQGFSNLASEWWHFDYGNQSWAFHQRQKAAQFGLIYPNDYDTKALGA